MQGYFTVPAYLGGLHATRQVNIWVGNCIIQFLFIFYCCVAAPSFPRSSAVCISELCRTWWNPQKYCDAHIRIHKHASFCVPLLAIQRVASATLVQPVPRCSCNSLQNKVEVGSPLLAATLQPFSDLRDRNNSQLYNLKSRSGPCFVTYVLRHAHGNFDHQLICKIKFLHIFLQPPVF